MKSTCCPLNLLPQEIFHPYLLISGCGRSQWGLWTWVHEHPCIRPRACEEGWSGPINVDDCSESASVNSQTVQLPLPDDLDASEVVDVAGSDELNLFGHEEDSPHWDGYRDIPPQPSTLPNQKTFTLDDASVKSLKSMVTDSCLGTKPTFKFKMPWERKGLAQIFNKDPAKLIPIPVMGPIDFDALGNQTSSSVPLVQGKARGAFSDVINFRKHRCVRKRSRRVGHDKSSGKVVHDLFNGS